MLTILGIDPERYIGPCQGQGPNGPGQKWIPAQTWPRPNGPWPERAQAQASPNGSRPLFVWTLISWLVASGKQFDDLLWTSISTFIQLLIVPASWLRPYHSPSSERKGKGG